MKCYCFKYLLQQNGWLQNAYVTINDDGIITSLSATKPQTDIAIETVTGAALPGFQNAHCHAFQYAMAGTAEQHEPNAQDDFWSWREAMYKCALAFTPQQTEEVAYNLYKHLLRNGYTSVAEFHYLHHDVNGKPYNNLAEMGERLISAAKRAGIKITLVPVFYQQGDFNQPPQSRQRRFICNTRDDYFLLLESSKQAVSYYDNASLGYGVHSLRAAKADDLIAIYNQGLQQLPFHIHAAEQLPEVERCLSHLHQRPIEWLLNNLPLNENFNLVHCTHLNDDEVKRLAESNANVVLCPATEGNLGDGIFRLTDYKKYKGNFSIGTDSNIGLNPLEDLRWLDYGQRLTHHKRNTFADGASSLINTTFFAGVKAMGISVTDFFAEDKPLNAVIYDTNTTLLSQASVKNLLPVIVYTSDPSMIKGTIINGKWMYKNKL